jgi:hypothetical protein
VPGKQVYINSFITLLKKKGIDAELSEEELFCRAGTKQFTLDLAQYFDLMARQPVKLAALVQSKLSLNTRIFARSCAVQKIDKATAREFLDNYHLMHSTQSASNYGLFYKEELIAVASFSKGRKMDRLAEDQQSFELIRFCCKDGITVTGGLTKLVKNFCREKKAGDVMTYVDKQFSNGSAFVTAGFKNYGETEPNYFLIDKATFERTPLKNKDESFDTEKFYLTQNSGSIKLVYNPGDTV